MQSTKPTESQNKELPEERQKEPSGAKSQTSPSVTATSKPNHAGELTTAEAHQPPQATSRETAKAKPEKMSTAGAGAAGAGDAGAGDAGAGASGTSVVTAADQSSTEPDMDDLALDSLIDTLGGPEDDLLTDPAYSYLDVMNPMTDAELAEALYSVFTCSAAPAEERSLPEEVGDGAVQAFLDTLGGPEPELEEYLSPVVEVSEARAEEGEKAGERDDTVPPEYRLLLELDTDGMPMLPEPEEIPKPLSDYDLVDEFSKDFACPAQPAVQYTPSTPSSTSQKPSDPVSAKTAEAVVVPRATACTVQSSAPSAVSSVGHVADEVLEVLSGSLGKREPDPGDKKPAVDKVQGGKEMDEALDLLSDSLGQREPGPDENKPAGDEVKCTTKVEKKRPGKRTQRMKHMSRVLKRLMDGPPAANLRSRKRAKR
ncbi:calpastatin-like [Phalacrocorax carbo]|uniref:calpastatin-like n=1 Tax=Phalacrocorax carbo TaxID=9209 RepID=UPI003119B873